MMEAKEQEFLSEEELSDVAGGMRPIIGGDRPCTQESYDKCIKDCMKSGSYDRKWCEVYCQNLKP